MDPNPSELFCMFKTCEVLEFSECLTSSIPDSLEDYPYPAYPAYPDYAATSCGEFRPLYLPEPSSFSVTPALLKEFPAPLPEFPALPEHFSENLIPRNYSAEILTACIFKKKKRSVKSPPTGSRRDKRTGKHETCSELYKYMLNLDSSSEKARLLKRAQKRSRQVVTL